MICIKNLEITINSDDCLITSPSPLPNGEVGVAYSYTFTSSGITGTLHWQISSGDSAGLDLNEATGELYGTPLAEVVDDTFTVHLFNESGQECFKVFQISIGAYDCLGNPSAIQDAVWVKDAFMPAAPCGEASIVAGVGTWSIQKSGACASGYVDIGTTLCNPGSDYVITVDIPWDDSGTILPIPPYDISFILRINGVDVDTVTRSLITGPFTNVVLTGTVPTGASNTIKLRFSPVPLPDPQYDVFSNGNLTITPLTPP